MTTIRQMVQSFTADKKLTREEAQSLVDKVNQNGTVSRDEKLQLRNLVAAHRDQFEAGALEILAPITGTVRPPAPQPNAGSVLNLDPSGAHRPVYLTASGVFSATPDGAAPRDAVELGDALFRAAELIDDVPGNVFLDARATPESRAATFQNLEAALAKVAPGAALPPGMDANQALQLRSSAATVMLHLLEASPEPQLRDGLLAAYEKLVTSEPDRRLREPAIFHLANSAAAQSGPVKAVADRLMKDLAPLTPPYEKWFANGNKTVNLSWTVGPEFVDGFKSSLTNRGFKEIPSTSPGVTLYEKTFDKPGVGETTFRIGIRTGGSNLLAPVGDGKTHIIGYDGHSNWGKAMTGSIRSGPRDPNGGDGQVYVYNLCVGKGVLDRLKETYPNLQAATTFGASSSDTDIDQLCEDIAGRKGWDVIEEHMNETSWPRGNFLTPITTLRRERVLDRDNDGQADYLDKFVNFNLFRVPEDTAREFQPVSHGRPAKILDGTKVNVAAQVLNTVAEFSSILDRHNGDSRVVADGYYEGKPTDREIVKFYPGPRGRDGRPEIRMAVNSNFAHLSEEALRAVTVYEFNRYLGKTGQLGDAVDWKLSGMLSFAQSLDIDEGWRDQELWGTFLKRYSLPDVGFAKIKQLLDAEHHSYAGTPEMIRTLRAGLTPEQLQALQRDQAGEVAPG